MTSLNYRPEIDGLRAVAVIGVILFHLGYSWIPGGFIGVDVFFVISGFLISSIILKELENGSFSFREFWARRIRRILPAMLTVTASTLAVTYLFVFRPEQQQIGRQALASIFSVSNVYFWKTTDSYWGSESEESPFLHTWSLSVEEQFYLFLPIGMWLVFRLFRSWLQEAVLVAILASLWLFLWAHDIYPTATFYLLPTRIWELGAGCLLAVTKVDKRPSPSFSIFATVGLGLIILAFIFVPKLNEALALAIFGTALILGCGHHGFSQKLLSHGAMRHIGKLSYSLYLWHWPVLVLARPLGFDLKNGVGTAVALVTTYVLAFASYHLIEKPVRYNKGMLGPIFCGVLLVGFAAYSMASTARSYTAKDGFVTPVDTFGLYTIHPTESPHKSLYKTGGLVTIREHETPQLVMLGDSHGVCAAKVIDEIAERNGISTAFYVMSGLDPFCKIPPVAESRREFRLPPEIQRDVDESMLRHLDKWKPRTVLICCRWNAVNQEQAHHLMECLQERQIRVLLLEGPPFLDIPEGAIAMKTAIYSGMKYTGGLQYWPAKETDTNTIAHKLADRFENVEVIPICDLYLKGDSVLLFNGRECVFRDYNHMTAEGYRIAAERINKAIVHQYADSK